MADAQHDDPQRRRPHPQTMAAPFLEFDLTREIDQLRREPRPASGQNAKTLAKHDDFRIVLMTLEAQARIPNHRAEGRISGPGFVPAAATVKITEIDCGELAALGALTWICP